MMETAVAIRETESQGGLPGLRLVGPEAEELLRDFLGGRKESTLRAYTQDLNDFADFLGAQTLKNAVSALISQGQGHGNRLVLRYRAQMQERGLQASTVNRRLAAIRSLLKLARRLGVIDWTCEIENLKTEPLRDTKGPGKDGYRGMRELISQRKDLKGIRDLAILRLLHDLGLRRKEVTDLDLADIDVSRSTVAVLGKGQSKKQDMIMPGPTMEALQDWIDVRGTETGPLFTNVDWAGKGDGRLSTTSVYRIVRDLGEQIGIKTRPHGIRHTACTEAWKKGLAAGHTPEKILDFSRHKSLKTLERYVDRDRSYQAELSALIAD